MQFKLYIIITSIHLCTHVSHTVSLITVYQAHVFRYQFEESLEQDLYMNNRRKGLLLSAL